MKMIQPREHPGENVLLSLASFMLGICPFSCKKIARLARFVQETSRILGDFQESCTVL